MITCICGMDIILVPALIETNRFVHNEYVLTNFEYSYIVKLNNSTTMDFAMSLSNLLAPSLESIANVCPRPQGSTECCLYMPKHIHVVCVKLKND